MKVMNRLISLYNVIRWYCKQKPFLSLCSLPPAETPGCAPFVPIPSYSTLYEGIHFDCIWILKIRQMIWLILDSFCSVNLLKQLRHKGNERRTNFRISVSSMKWLNFKRNNYNNYKKHTLQLIIFSF